MKDMQKQRLIAIGRQIWQSLTNDEQEDYYYTEGKIGFLEDETRRKMKKRERMK